MGQKRKEVYKSTDYHCICCGINKNNAKYHKWLEAHEYWKFDYFKGIGEILDIVPLCHSCYNFIHSGRLSKIIGKEKTINEVKDILEHGLKILSENYIKCFPFTLEFAKYLNCKTYNIESYNLPEDIIEWSDWKLIWNNKEYKSKFNSYEEWYNFYNSKIIEE